MGNLIASITITSVGHKNTIYGLGTVNFQMTQCKLNKMNAIFIELSH